MKLKHTPGPWRKCNANNGNCPCGLIWSVKGDFVLATVTSSCKEHESSNLGEGLQRGNEEYQANSRLIAAAPDMIEDKIKDYTGIGKWLSAALEDLKVCDEMKKDIKEWFDRFKTFKSATGLSIEHVLEGETKE